MATPEPTVSYKAIPDFPGYRVGDDGSVWTCRKMKGRGRGPGGGFRAELSDEWKRLRPGRDRTGHLYVCLYAGDKRSWPYVHHLVLLAFVGPRPAGMDGCHFPDRDPANNRLSNLRWDTPTGNAADKEVHGTVRRGEKHPNATVSDEKVARIRELRRQGLSLTRIAAETGVSRTHCGAICAGRTRAAAPVPASQTDHDCAHEEHCGDGNGNWVCATCGAFIAKLNLPDGPEAAGRDGWL